MINKQGLWFLTLFSLMIVLGIYYVTMPNEIFENENIIKENNKKEEKVQKAEEVNSENTSYVETLKIELDEERTKLLETLKEVMNDNKKSSEDKNNAYEQIKEINNIKAKEELLIKKIKEKYSLDAYVKENENEVEIVIESKKHDIELANKIMKTVQENYNDPMNISVKFS